VKLYALIRQPAEIVSREARQVPEVPGKYIMPPLVPSLVSAGGFPESAPATVRPGAINGTRFVSVDRFAADPLCGLSRAEVADGYVATTARQIEDAKAALGAAREEHRAALELATQKESKMQIPNRQQGFSVLELLIVVAIIGLLASIPMTRMMCEIRKAKVVAAEASARAAQSDIEAYRVSSGRLPETLAEVYPDGAPSGLIYSLLRPAPLATSGSPWRSPALPPSPTQGVAGGYLLAVGRNLCPGCGVNVDHVRAEGFGPVIRVSMPAAGNPGGGGGGPDAGPVVMCPNEDEPKCPEERP